MAGALGLRLSGPRVYGDGQMSDDPYVNADKPDPIADDLLRGLQLSFGQCSCWGVCCSASGCWADTDQSGASGNEYARTWRRS